MADAAGTEHPTQPETQRLFFALWPDDATRDALDRTGKWLQQHWGGRRMRADTLHMTLAFLGATPTESCDALLPYIDAVRADPFELRLDQTGSWPHNRVGWLGCSTPSAPLFALPQRLYDALKKAGNSFDAKPFVPHVTLLRNTAGGPLQSCTPVHWQVRSFVLIASRTKVDGPHYQVLQRWPLV